jgi:hypothetical protein
MTALVFLASFAFPGGIVGLLFKIAVVCVVIWGIWALIKWSGFPVPEPLRILGIVVICIIALYWLYELYLLAV